jgi:pyruvate kinase
MSKIEKPQAVARLAEIIELSDALMVARGDLGVEMPLEAVPGIQKQITRAARRAGKPVVVATQMLESMITAPVPTRAEVSDVSIAVFEGADAIMLSAESASGQYPVEAVATMNRIAMRSSGPALSGIINAQRSRAGGDRRRRDLARRPPDRRDAEAVGDRHLHGVGHDRIRAARERPQVPIIALSPILAHGAAPVAGLGPALRRHRGRGISTTWSIAPAASPTRRFGKPGDRIIITAGVPLGTPGATNMLRIAYIGRPSKARAKGTI